MTETQKLTLSYGLTYVALGLAINGSFPLALIFFIISDAILVIRLLQQESYGSLVPVIISGTLQVSLLIAGMNSLMEIDTTLFIASGLLAIYNILFSYVMSLLPQQDKSKIILGCGITFTGFAALLIAGDYIMKTYVPFIDSGILAGFWALCLLMGTGILVTALFSLPYRARIIIEPAGKSKLS